MFVQVVVVQVEHSTTSINGVQMATTSYYQLVREIHALLYCILLVCGIILLILDSPPADSFCHVLTASARFRARLALLRRTEPLAYIQ